MYTEKQAREQWCPMVRMPISTHDNHDGPPLAACNTSDTTQRLNAGANCIASKCAMWRWNPPFLKDGPETGHCGLAPIHSTKGAE